MQRGFRFRNYKLSKLQNSQRGYMMITLMLAVALVTIGLLAVLPDIKQQIQRDREEELRHRGTAYMRAIQHFYRKFNRYPTTLEELENTNNVRFLRKRYKDPMSRDPKTGKEKDFQLLHQQDISLNSGLVLSPTPGGLQPGGSQPGGLQPGGLQPGGSPTGGIQPGSSAGGQTSESGESGQSSSGSSNSGASGNSGSSGLSPSNSSSSSGLGFNGPTFGGGPILGVASTNKKDKTIRVFADKTHYNDWLFIYVQQLDRGGLLVGPVNPNAPPPPNLNGLTPAPGQQPGGIAPGGLTPGGQNPSPPQPPQNFPQTPPQQ